MKFKERSQNKNFFESSFIYESILKLIKIQYYALFRPNIPNVQSGFLDWPS